MKTSLFKKSLAMALSFVMCFSAAASGICENMINAAAVTEDNEIKSDYELLTQPCYMDQVESVEDSYFEELGAPQEADYRKWAQSDSEWGGIWLGNYASTSVANLGCTVTALTKLIIQSGLRSSSNYNVATFVQSMKEIGAFTEGGGFNGFYKINQKVSGFTVADYCPTAYDGKQFGMYDWHWSDDPKVQETIINWIKAGKHVLIALPYSYSGGFHEINWGDAPGHWIAVDEAKTLASNRVYIMDSLNYGNANADIQLTDRYAKVASIITYTGGSTPSGTVSTEPTFSVSGLTVPAAMWQGSQFSVRGEVACSKTMQGIGVEVYDVSGKQYAWAAADPKGNSYPLGYLDALVIFDTIPAGTYYYRVYAMVDGNFYTVHQSGFSIFTKEQKISNGNYYIESELKSGNVVQLAFYNTKDVKLNTSSSTYGKWNIQYAGNGYYKIKNLYNNTYLTVEDNKSSTGTNVICVADNGGDGQLWQILSNGKNYCLAPKCSGTAILDVQDSLTEDGNIFIYTAHLDTNQRFKLVPIKQEYEITLKTCGGLNSDGYRTTVDGKVTDYNYIPIHATNWEFEGYYTKGEGGTKVNESTVYTANTTVYAHWKKTQPTVTVKGNYTYTGSKITPVIEVKCGTKTLKEGVHYTVSVENNVNAGTAKFTVKETDYWSFDDDFYRFTDISGTFAINKAKATFTALPSAGTDLVYDGTAKQLITAGKSANGMVVYSIDGGNTFTADIPTATKVGEYTIKYKATGTGNYTDSDIGTLTVNIGYSEKKIQNISVTLRDVVVSYRYEGTDVSAGFEHVSFSEVTPEMVDWMIGTDEEMVSDFVNAFSAAGTECFTLSAAQMKAVQYILG